MLRLINSKLDYLIRLAELILQKEVAMSQATDNLAKAVQRETDVVSSVTTLISGLATQIRNSSDDPKVQALADQISANNDTLAKAVTDNTPAATDPNAPA